ncbi:MAG: carbon-nitrogen family hydrolase [Fibrobacteria bacterium]|nr:carbon-nitrogen family hydrolase [Fibrobacteria bacterium]
MRVFLVQSAVIWGQPHKNRNNVEELLKRKRIKDGDLIVLPELFSTGFLTAKKDLGQKKLQGILKEDTVFLSYLSKKYQCFLLGSSLGFRRGKFENLSLFFNPDGILIGKYKKIHPFSIGGEHKYFSSGSKISVFEMKAHKTLLQTAICYDLRFPEFFRSGSTKGAEIICVQANWPASRQAHWNTLLQARAIENQAWVIGVNRTGWSGSLVYAGGSQLIDPRGERRLIANKNEGVYHYDINIGSAEHCRVRFPVLKDRRPWGLFS